MRLFLLLHSWLFRIIFLYLLNTKQTSAQEETDYVSSVSELNHSNHILGNFGDSVRANISQTKSSSNTVRGGKSNSARIGINILKMLITNSLNAHFTPEII